MGGYDVKAFGGRSQAAKDVAASDHDGEFNAFVVYGDDFVRDVGKRIGVDTRPPATHQGLTRKLEKDALVPGSGAVGHRAIYTTPVGRDPSLSLRLRMTAAPSLHIRHDFSREVVAAFLDSLTQFVAGEARDRVRATGVFAGGLEVLADVLFGVADVRLLEQASLAVELFHLAGDHLLDDVVRLARFHGLIARDLTLGPPVLPGDIFPPTYPRLPRSAI